MTSIKPARTELLALAAAVRDEDWARHLDGALTAAANAGWDWRRAGREACRLIFGADDAEPREITDATRSPFQRPRLVPPPPAEVVPIRKRPLGAAERAREQVAASRRERHAELDGAS